MNKLPHDELLDSLSIHGATKPVDQQVSIRLRKRFAEEFRKQLLWGFPTNADEQGLRKLAKQLRAQKVVVKLFVRHSLHAKLYLLFRKDPINPIIGYLGSSNLTFPGLSSQGELNIDVLDSDATIKLAKWFDARWNDKFSIDITEVLIEIIENSWACEPATPACERHPKHHDLVKAGVEHIASEELRIGGQLGRPSGARFRCYERLKAHSNSIKGTLFETPELLKAIDEIYRYPLRPAATDKLNRQLRIGISDLQLAELVLALREEDRLCIVEETEHTAEPRIICSQVCLKCREIPLIISFQVLLFLLKNGRFVIRTLLRLNRDGICSIQRYILLGWHAHILNKKRFRTSNPLIFLPEELGWSQPASVKSTNFTIDECAFTCTQIAQLGGVVVFEVLNSTKAIPDKKTCQNLHN